MIQQELDTAFEIWANTSNNFDDRHAKDAAWEKYTYLRDKGLLTDSSGKALYYAPGQVSFSGRPVILRGRTISPINISSYYSRKLQ